MCEPISATLFGIATAASSIMQTVGAHQQAQAQAAYSNAVAQQQYANQLTIAKANDAQKGLVFEAELKANAAAKSAYYSQLSLNQASANTAITAETQKLQEKRTAASFSQQKALIDTVQAQGTILAQGKTGQSEYLRIFDTTRQLGFEQAQIDQSIYDANRAAGLAVEGVLLDQTSANIAAWNGLPADPLSPAPSALPPEPIMVGGPSNLALIGGIGSGILGGVTSGISVGTAFNNQSVVN